MTKTLYDPSFEHDACGVGMVADLSATATNATILDALTILENLEHRGASGSDADSGDGAGLLIQMPDSFLREEFDALTRSSSASVSSRSGGATCPSTRPCSARPHWRRSRALSSN